MNNAKRQTKLVNIRHLHSVELASDWSVRRLVIKITDSFPPGQLVSEIQKVMKNE